MPYYVRPEEPPGILQRKRNAPRHPLKLLVDETVPQIQKQHAIVPKHPLHFLKHGDEAGDVFLWRAFQPYLAIVVVISEGVVRRARTHHLHAGFW